MNYYRTIFVIGLWVIIIPFLGIPLLAKKILLILPGALLLLIGILLSQEKSKESSDSGISYAETIPKEDHIFTHIDESDASGEEDPYQEEE